MSEKQKILIVDDDEDISELISLYLVKECFDTERAEDGDAALRLFNEYQPDLILLDIMLPGKDGYDICREIRKTSKVPIIMLSAKGEIFDQSINSGKLKAPFAVNGPAHTSVIQGWKEGLIGMKIGGVRELTIPADKAYGNKSQGDKIPANSPLKFVVMAIEKPAEIPRPEMPEVIKRYYRSRGLNV